MPRYCFSCQCPSFDLFRNVGHSVSVGLSMSGSSFLLQISLLHICQMLCKDNVGILKDFLESITYLLIEKLYKDQKTNLKIGAPFVLFFIKNNYALNLKKHLLCLGETQESNLSVYSSMCRVLCMSLCACLCKLLLCLILALWEMSCAWLLERVENVWRGFGIFFQER